MPMLWPERGFASQDDRLACRLRIEAGSKSFAAASRLLPASIREHAFALYGFCRFSDDLVDQKGASERSIQLLRERLSLAYEGRPADSPVDRCFTDMLRQSGMPRALPEALIDGLAWDVKGVTCHNLSDLCAYGARVAGSVGAMMTVLMGVTDRALLARACDLGVAMQMTNIARDVGEDAAMGRLYLPQDWLIEEGVNIEKWRQNPQFTPAIGRVVARLLQSADELYRRADSGISALPARCRPAIKLARHLYREIGVAVEGQGYDSVSRRAVVSRNRKIQLAGRALASIVWPNSEDRGLPPLAETAFLVDAASDSARRDSREPALGRVSHSILWVAALFASLDDRSRFSGERA